jgi:hypothetical protein
MSLQDTRLYQQLERDCQQYKGYPLDGTELLAMLKSATRNLADLLNRASTNFEEYTLHDEKHAIRVVHLMHRLMGEALSQRLNVIELVLLILAAYGHDTGMAVARQERERHERGADFKDFLLQHDDEWNEARRAQEEGDDARYRSLMDRLFQDYLRGIHHRLSRQLIENDCKHLFNVQERSLARPLAVLCESHGQTIAEVARLRSDKPFALQFEADLPFLACVLRLADFLDLDATRAPKSLMELIRIRSDVSRMEWIKHQAGNFSVSETKIRFDAVFDNFHEDKALRDTLKGLEAERRDCMEFLRSRPERMYRLALESPITDEYIETRGYIYAEFAFTLEYQKIMELLMGYRLYGDERVYIRELIQNALDACRHAEATAEQSRRSDYNGRITVRAYRETSGGTVREVLEVSDNGVGMTQAIVRDYFMRVGRSYYGSNLFRLKRLHFQPMSQFGIGILSCFMVADDVEVETCPDRDAYPDATPGGLKLEIHGPYQYFIVRPLDRREPGTTVRVYLNRPAAEVPVSTVRRFVGRLPYAVTVIDHDGPPVEVPRLSFEFTDTKFSLSFLPMPDSFGYRSATFELPGRLGFGLHGRFRFHLFEYDGRCHLALSDAGKYAEVRFGPAGETQAVIRKFTPESRRSLDDLLRPIAASKAKLPQSVRADLETVLRNFDRVCDGLLAELPPQEVTALAKALSAEITAFAASTAVQGHPAWLHLKGPLDRAAAEVESFVSGRLTLSSPTGVLTQDGMDLNVFTNLPAWLSLGIGYFYNIDLCGPHRLSLNAARNQVILDERSRGAVRHLHGLIGEFLGRWFREVDVPLAEVNAYLAAIPESLSRAVDRSYRARVAACDERRQLGDDD